MSEEGQGVSACLEEVKEEVGRTLAAEGVQRLSLNIVSEGGLQGKRLLVFTRAP